MTSPNLRAIRASIASLVDDIEVAAHRTPRDGPWLDRHPLVFAIASLGIELVGWRLIEQARKHRNIATPHWWTPRDSEARVH